MKKIIYTLLFLFVLLILRVFFISIYTIDQNSMNNTYNNGDHVLLIKNLYKIKRNDIVIFNRENEDLIKRCIGLPGDSIKISNGKIFVNDNLIKNPEKAIINGLHKNDIFLESLIYDSYGTNWNPNNFDYYLIPKKGTKIVLNSKNLSLYENLVKLDNNNSEVLNQPYYIFKNDYFYLIGDNRKASIDSRFFGPIKSSNIMGKVLFPLN